jgi:hypothetical protein
MTDKADVHMLTLKRVQFGSDQKQKKKKQLQQTLEQEASVSPTDFSNTWKHKFQDTG